MRQNPIPFGGCCDKCGRPHTGCVCVRKIVVKEKDNGIDGKGISELLKAKRYSEEEVKEKQLDFANWLNSEFVVSDADTDELIWIHNRVKKTTAQLYALYQEYQKDSNKYPIK